MWLMVMWKCRYNLTDKNIKTSLSGILGDVFIFYIDIVVLEV